MGLRNITLLGSWRSSDFDLRTPTASFAWLLRLLGNLARLGVGETPPFAEVAAGGGLAAIAAGMVDAGVSAVLQRGLWDTRWVVVFL